MRRLILTLAVVLAGPPGTVYAQHHGSEAPAHATETKPKESEAKPRTADAKAATAGPGAPAAAPTLASLASKLAEVADVIDSRRGVLTPIRVPRTKPVETEAHVPGGRGEKKRAPVAAPAPERNEPTRPRVELEWRPRLLVWPDELLQSSDETAE